MSDCDKSEMITVKLIGSKQAVNKMIQTLEDTFLFTSRGRLFKNDKDDLFHSFIDINPYFLFGESVRKQLESS